jgi:lipopolysaccharide transport system permease protein
MSVVGEAFATTEQNPDHPKIHVHIEAQKGFKAIQFSELWNYRDLLWFMTIRDIKAQYQQMALGPLWLVIRPVMSMIIFSLIFGGLARMPSNGLPYPVFSFTALLPWGYFSSLANDTSSSLRNNMGLISKVYFPRVIPIVKSAINGLFDMTMPFLILIGMMIFYKIPITPAILLLPLYILLAALTALGFGLWLSGISVKYRDITIGFNYFLSALQWATPIAYSAEVVLQRVPNLYWLYKLNPMFWVIEGFRWALLGKGQGPDLYMLIPVGAVLVLFVSGLFVFHRFERIVVDIQ